MSQKKQQPEKRYLFSCLKQSCYFLGSKNQILFLYLFSNLNVAAESRHILLDINIKP